MDIKTLQRLVVDALEDIKGQDITVYDTVGQTDLFDSVAVVSGTSNRQTRALAASVRDKVKAAGGDVISIEGEDTGEWVLVDLGDMVVHIMQPGIRQYYNLEELWGTKPVSLASLKGPAKKAAPRKSASPSDTAADATPAAKAPARKTARKAPADTVATDKVAGKKIATKKVAAKKAATANTADQPVLAKTPGRKTGAVKTAATKSAATRTAATKSPATKAAAKPATTRSAARKTSGKAA